MGLLRSGVARGTGRGSIGECRDKTRPRAARLVPLHGDFDSFGPHGEERGQRPRVSSFETRSYGPLLRMRPIHPHGEEPRAARRLEPFETAGKSRPPQDEEVTAQPVKITV